MVFINLTMDELLNARRYYYPRFKDGLSMLMGIFLVLLRELEVDTILALLSVEGSDNVLYDDWNSLLLMLDKEP